MYPTYWSLLLNAWQAGGHAGLTIPYLVGSQRLLPPTYSGPIQSIEAMLKDIIYSPEPVLLKYCMNINDVILERYGDHHVRILGQFRSYQGASQTGLYISNFFTDLGVTTEDAIAVLSDRYSDHVDKGWYSKHEDGRSDFSADDRRFIRTTFAQLRDIYFH